MIARIARRMLAETNFRLLCRFAYGVGWQSMRAVSRFRRSNGALPAFLFISVTSACNLRCQGCWVSPHLRPGRMEPEVLDRIIRQGRRSGIRFFGILGGEPLLYPGLLELLGRHQDCYFQLFTNGTLIDEATARTMRRLGNISPLISVEGLEQTSDVRRGGDGVYARSVDGIRHCAAAGLIAGIATSVCRSNIRELATEAFVRRAVELRVQYLWYYIYRPVGPNPCPELALSGDQILDLRRFIVDMRAKAPLVIVDAYWDHAGRALCPAAVGISHHIGPHGDVEPCPPVQFASDSVADGGDLAATIRGSAFIRDFRRSAAQLTRGCLLLEAPSSLRDLVLRSGARATSGRPDALGELAAMRPLPGHHQPGREIPERSLFYRFAKKNWFFGFGAYG